MGEWEKQVNALRDDIVASQKRVHELERQLADALKGKVPEAQETIPEMISVESMVASKTLEPQVVIRWGSMITQAPIEAAKQLAFQLLEASEAAVSDAFLVNFLREKIGAKDVDYHRILIDFREYRQLRETKEAT